MEQSISSGDVIDGRFEVISILGSGGMGSVFKARQIEFDRLVAIKTLDPAMVSDKEFSERFRREAKILSELTHPNICKFFSYGVLPTGLPYIVMEYVEGQSLQAILQDGPLGTERTLAMAQEICSAVSFAHKSGIIHRDLKPQNIIVSTQGAVKLLDFGLAKYESREQILTKTGELIGTPEFLSPEQCAGRHADERSDIYSTACILYQMLTGKLPFESENSIGFLAKHLNEIPEAPSKLIKETLPKGLDTLLLKALEKNPDDRQQSMVELQEHLLAVQKGLGTSLQLTLSSKYEQADSAKKQSKVKLLIAFGTVFVIGAAIAAGLTFSANDHSKRSVEQLTESLEAAHKRGDESSESSFLSLIETRIRLKESAPLKRANEFCALAQRFQREGLRKPAIKMALNAMTESTSIRLDFSRALIRKMNNAVDGLVTRLLDDKSMEALQEKENQKKLSPKETLDNIVTILEDSSKILVYEGYKPDKKFVKQCCGFIAAKRSRLLESSYFDELIIEAYKAGQLQLGTCVLKAYEDQFVIRLKNASCGSKEFSSLAEPIEKILVQYYGAKSPNVPGFFFNAGNDARVQKEACINKLYEYGKSLITKYKFDLDHAESARMLNIASTLARRTNHHQEAREFVNLAYKHFEHVPDANDKSQILMPLSQYSLEEGHFDEAIKYAKEGFAICDEFRNDGFLRSSFAQLWASALYRQGKIKEALEVFNSELEFLRAHDSSEIRLYLVDFDFALTIAGGDKIDDDSLKLLRKILRESAKLAPQFDAHELYLERCTTFLNCSLSIGSKFKNFTQQDWDFCSELPDDAWKKYINMRIEELGAWVNEAEKMHRKDLVDLYYAKMETLLAHELSSQNRDLNYLARIISISKRGPRPQIAESLLKQAKQKLPESDYAELVKQILG